MSGPETSYRNGLTRAPRIQYRDAGPHTIFPDPLFKEQWYLVSKVCVRNDFSLFFVRFVRLLGVLSCGVVWWNQKG